MNSPENISREQLKSNAVKTIVKGCLIIMALGFLYYVFIRITGISLPCYIYQLTGYKCPSCGITRMCIHMSKLKFKEAFHDNIMAFIMWPFVAIDIIYIVYKSLIREKIPIATYIISYVMVGIAVIFCIIRNVYKI